MAGGWRVRRVLRARAPFDAAALIAFLSYRAVPGVEDVAPYRRALRLAHGAAVATLEPAPGGMRADLDLDDPRDEEEALAQLAALLDLDAPAEEIAAVLGRDPRTRTSRPACASRAARATRSRCGRSSRSRSR